MFVLQGRWPRIAPAAALPRPGDDPGRPEQSVAKGTSTAHGSAERCGPRPLPGPTSASRSPHTGYDTRTRPGCWRAVPISRWSRSGSVTAASGRQRCTSGVCRARGDTEPLRRCRRRGERGGAGTRGERQPEPTPVTAADFVSMLEDIKQTLEAIRAKDGAAAGGNRRAHPCGVRTSPHVQLRVDGRVSRVRHWFP